MNAKAYVDDLHDRFSLFYDTNRNANILNKTKYKFLIIFLYFLKCS